MTSIVTDDLQLKTTWAQWSKNGEAKITSNWLWREAKKTAVNI